MATMKCIIPPLFGEKEKKEFVLRSEKRFEENLDRVVKNLLSVGDLRTVLLSGPSCAGKTTTVKKITVEAKKRGKTVVSVSIDDFYKDREQYERECARMGKEADLEVADAIDVKYFEECVSNILTKKIAFMPTFDFKIGRRVSLTPYKTENSHILIFEGIQAIYPEFRRLFENSGSKFIFVDAADSLETPYFHFSGRDLRLARRLVRDFYRRGASAQKTFSMWGQVVANENRSIYPNVGAVDFVISSTMEYEPMMMKKYLVKILGSVKPEETCYGMAQEILSRYTFFPEISEKYLPKDSVYHEFL